jgi:hypothetical protein
MTPTDLASYNPDMRITDSDGNAIDRVSLAISPQEAYELSRVLADAYEAEEGWRAHVTDAAVRRQITIYREDDPTSLVRPPQA